MKKDERLLIDKANIAEGAMNALDDHLEKNNLEIEDVMNDIIIIQFEDALIQLFVSYDKSDDSFVIKTVELKEGDEIYQNNQRLHMIESERSVH